MLSVIALQIPKTPPIENDLCMKNRTVEEKMRQMKRMKKLHIKLQKREKFVCFRKMEKTPSKSE